MAHSEKELADLEMVIMKKEATMAAAVAQLERENELHRSKEKEKEKEKEPAPRPSKARKLLRLQGPHVQ